MKNKKQEKRPTLRKQMKKLTVKTPFADAGSIAGKAVGGMFGNASLGKGVGKWLGSGIGQIFGSGDYQIAGAVPKYNVITNGNQIPKFSTERQTNVVCHREYLGDISGTAAFNVGQYPLNPGMANTFPWLSTVAQNYQEYKFHGLVFEFRSLITDYVTSGAPGTVIMATNYNAGDATYTTKQQMENSEFAVSTKPTINLMHGVECADTQTILPQRYVRNTPVPAGQDVRLYDAGLFQFATQANPVQDLGELWVSYCVEFFKPSLSNDVGGTVSSVHQYRTLTSGAIPFGANLVTNTGDISLVVTNSTISWVAYPATRYQITLMWTGTASTIVVPSTGTSLGLTVYNILSGGAGSLIVSPNSGTSATYQMTAIVGCTLAAAGTVSYSLGTGGSYPTTGGIDIIITEISGTV
jgi:hypothetical protein